MLGQVDQDDPTNLPPGCAATCKNTDFTRDSTGSSLSATTRAGNCLTAQGLPSPGTGLWDFQYEPEFAGDPFFQQLLRFSMTGTLEREYPSGTGRMIPVPAGMFTPPTYSHKIDTQTANLVFSAYSSAVFAPNAAALSSPSAGCSVYNPKTLNLDPLGMKPFGWYWQPTTFVYAKEVACPSISNSGQQGNGHTYQAQNAGYTGPNEPVWPLTEGGTVTETLSAAQIALGLTPVTWKELTMVIANRIPAPPAPTLALVSSAGTFPANQTVYILLTFTNGMGETIGGAAASITTTAAGQGVQVTVPTLASLPGWLSQLVAPYAITGANIYEADVPFGDPAPPQSLFYKATSGIALGASYTVTGSVPSGIVTVTESSTTQTVNQDLTDWWETVDAGVQWRATGYATSGGLTSPLEDFYSSDFGFALPSDADILGIEVSFNAQAQSATTGTIAEVGLWYSNALEGTAKSPATPILVIPGSTLTYGADSDVWEATLTAAIVNDPSFGFAISCSLDNIRLFLTQPFTMSITYQIGAGNGVPTINSARITPGQLSTPTAEPVLVRNPSAGTFPAGRDVWVRLSYSNELGETPLGPSNSIINTLADDEIQVNLVSVPQYPQITTINVYEADVPTGKTEPPIAAYALVGSYMPPATASITATATGTGPQTVNGTGPGGNIAADTDDGGINGTQGYRYAVPAWMNRNETISGFTPAAVSNYIVDEDGWEIAAFNVATGPPNIIGRIINWTVADGTQDGPFAWVGLVDLQVPTQNQIYPKSFLSDGITIIPTVFLDNVTTSGTFNFTDEFLTGEIAAGAEGNNTTDRLTLMAPPAAVRVDYLLTCDRMALTGVPGYSSGPVISLAADYESFDASTSQVPITTNSGEVCWGLLEYRNQIYAMRERSGIVLTPGSGPPNSWDAKARWSGDKGNGVGPCGPRAFAQNGQFIGFVHRTGFYKYDETTPDLMTKEIPREWGSINWAAATTISVTIDDDTHTVRIQAPVGQSMVPNKEFCLSYLEGWLNPIHFTTYTQKEVTQEASRRWSFNDVSAYICKRIYRTVPNPPPLPLGPDGVSQTTSDFYISQLAYTTTDQSGVINARTPGRFDDNGTGIDWVYETVSTQAMQKVCKPEGVSTSCNGYGPINVTFLAGRRLATDYSAPRKKLSCVPIVLSPDGPVDYTSKPDRAQSDYWRVRYDNGKQPGVWCSLKKATIYVIVVRTARASG